MTYYFYDKVLVSNLRLRTLESFAGKMTIDSVAQLSVQPVEQQDSAPTGEGISRNGDFYQVVLPEKVAYRIHKDGNLVRAYAEDPVWIEKTILGVPASVVALLKGKVLLQGSLVRAGQWSYAAVGRKEEPTEGVCDGIYTGTVPGNAVMVREHGGRLEGIAHLRTMPPDSEVATETLGLLGIFALHGDDEKEAIQPMETREEKKSVLLENIVGYELFPQELRQLANDSGIIDKISQELYMAYMRSK